MASYTKNLELLKKDPVEDGADTFNIETMLNENWDKIDEKVATGKAMNDHVTNQKNPHKVTAEQVGAASSVHSHTIDQVEGLTTALSNKANKIEPEQYDFPFAEGFQSYQPCKYWKNEFGEVTLQLSAYRNNAPLVAGNEYTLGYMPEGYRPKHQLYFVGFGNRYYQFYHINGEGKVRLLAREDVSQNAFNGATISYIAD